LGTLWRIDDSTYIWHIADLTHDAEEEQEINDFNLNSWPDNASLDKEDYVAYQEKYGNKVSWADLMVLVWNNCLALTWD
jgi:catalase (peroxidase I)